MSLNVKSNVEVNTSNAQASVKSLSKVLSNFNKITSDAKSGLDNLAHSAQALTGWATIAKNTFGGAAQSFIQTADAINTMNARLKLTTTSMAHFEALKKSIDGIAKSTYASSDSISNLFIGLNSSLKSLGVSQNEVLKFSETITQAFKVSGASAVDTERAIVQFSQALSTGKLQGQDFKAMIGAALAAEGAMTNLQTRILERIHSRIR